MKTLLLAVAIIFSASMGYCASVFKSSSTVGANHFEKTLCGGTQRGQMQSVIISSAGAAGALLSVCNSSFTTVGSVCQGPFDTRTVRQIDMPTQFPKGLIYTSTGTPILTFIYDCY